jgi:uncharacterized protein YbjT (DUF2867 family)
MNPLLLGATGRTGQLVMKQALSRGHCASNVDWTIVRPPRLISPPFSSMKRRGRGTKKKLWGSRQREPKRE